MLIAAEGISFERDGKTILDRLDFEISAGEIVTVIGPNGGGKTTLAKLCLGILAPSSGRIRRAQNLTIGYVPQRLSRDRSLPLTTERFLTLRQSASRQAVEQALEEVGAAHLIRSQLGTLSSGELQRVLLARAAMNQPKLLVLDEPVQGVDFVGEAALYELISAIRDRLSCAILLISHDLHIVMAQSNRVVCLNGHVCCEGVPSKISQHPEYARLFGSGLTSHIGVYAHKHNHEHSLCGDVHEGDCAAHHDYEATGDEEQKTDQPEGAR